MMHEKSIKKILQTIWTDPGTKGPALSDKELEIKRRYLAAFHFMMDDPSRRHSEIVSFLMTEFEISRSQAFVDIGNVKILFGNVQKSSKEYDRYVVVEGLKEMISQAKAKGDEKTAIYGYDKLGKYTRLDQDDGDKIPWEEIIPLDIEPTGDVSVLGLKPIPNLKEKQKELREKYGKIEDAKIIPDGQ